MKPLKRIFSIVLIACFVNVTLIQTAQATLITTEQVARIAAAERGDSPHERLAGFLARGDVQAELERLGVSPEHAHARIVALTDEEATLLAQQVDHAPAGGIIGAILLVFFVLLITDILGFTKVFPFTRSVK